MPLANTHDANQTMQTRRFVRATVVLMQADLYILIKVTPTNARMLNIWLNIKNNSSRKRIKNRECHATDHAFLRLWCKLEVRKFSRFVRFTFRVNMCTRIRQEHVYRAKSKYDIMRILSELVFIPQTQESIGCCMQFSYF